MACWLKSEDNSCTNQYNETSKIKVLKLQTYFNELLSGFLRDRYGNYCFRPLPPRLGNGDCVDLLELYLIVKQLGGFEAISENNLWGEVGLQCGSDSSFGCAFKLIYANYLGSFEIWLMELDKENTLDKLERDYVAYVSEVRDLKRGSDESCNFNLEKSVISFINLADTDDENESRKFDCEKLEKDYKGSNDGNVKLIESTDYKMNKGIENIMQAKSETSSENSIASKKGLMENEEVMMNNVDHIGVSKEEISSNKRERDCISNMLQWMANTAKDPTRCSKQKSYAKQALFTRESLLLQKRIRRQCSLQSRFQKKQKIHPSVTTSNPPPPRQRSEARLDTLPTPLSNTTLPRRRNSAGKAEVPEWTGLTTESDPKWLGTRTWPLEKAQNKQLIERDPIGKGRIILCGCRFPGSIECVKFHVSERRMKIMFELGTAFYAWNFDKMGEVCSVSWTIDEEKKFGRVIRESPPYTQKGFWEPMCRALPQKRWDDQVKYYYNVFMLRRRGYQNRHYPSNVDSDDDETEYRSTNNSVRHQN